MKKVIKKTKGVKKVLKKPAKVNTETPLVETSNLCPVCNGIGLARPDFVNSPNCENCKGNGII